VLGGLVTLGASNAPRDIRAVRAALVVVEVEDTSVAVALAPTRGAVDGTHATNAAHRLRGAVARVVPTASRGKTGSEQENLGVYRKAQFQLRGDWRYGYRRSEITKTPVATGVS